MKKLYFYLVIILGSFIGNYVATLTIKLLTS